MPTYDYRCPNGHVFTRRERYEAARTNCDCGETAVRRAFNLPFIHGETVSKGPSASELLEFASEVDSQYQRAENAIGPVRKPEFHHATITRARAKMIASGDFTKAKEQQITELEKRAV